MSAISSILLVVSLFAGSPLQAGPCKNGTAKTVTIASGEWEEFSLNSECVKDGPYKYFKQHRLQSKGHFRNNLQEGQFSFYDAAGRLRRTESYQSGHLHGLMKIYYSTPENILKETWHYNGGIVSGKRQKFDPFQNIQEELHYNDGFVDGGRIVYESVSRQPSDKLPSSHKKNAPKVVLKQEFKSGLLITESSIEGGQWRKVRVDQGSGEFYGKAVNDPLYANFSIQDIIGKERLSVLLPSDACRSHFRNVKKTKKIDLFMSSKMKGLRCLDQRNDSDSKEFGYTLYDNLGFRKETGFLKNGRRVGLITFYKKGKPIYRRSYHSHGASSQVYVFSHAKSDFKILMKRVAESALMAERPVRFHAEVGEYKRWDGVKSCQQALESKSFHLEALSSRVDLSVFSEDHKNLIEELCHAGCAAACITRSKSGRDYGEYLQTACNLGHEGACHGLSVSELELSYIRKIKPNKRCYIYFDETCVSSKTLRKPLNTHIPCLFGNRDYCAISQKIENQQYTKATAVCKNTDLSLSCETAARPYRKDLTDGRYEELLTMLCRKNSRKYCTPLAKFYARTEERKAEELLQQACQSGEQESCYLMATRLMARGKVEESEKILKNSCLKERSSKLVDKNAMMTARACRRLARVYRQAKKEDLSEKYLCRAEYILGYINKCHKIKISPLRRSDDF